MHYLFALIGIISLVIIFVLLLKKRKINALKKSNDRLNNEINKLEKKNELLSEKMNLDYLDTLYREKLNYGLKDEKIIRLK